MTTKDGRYLKRFMFEEGDVFVPQWDNVAELSKDSNGNEIKDSKGNLVVVYKLLCQVKDKNGEKVLDEEGNPENPENVFVNLTPAQYNSLKKKIDAVDEDGNKKYYISQHLFRAYLYDTPKYKNNVGIGFYPSRPKPKNIDDFEETKSSQEE